MQLERRQPAEAHRAFEELDALRLALEERLGSAAPSLRLYADAETGGFFHRLHDQKPGDPSKASTATCAAFLVSSGRWNNDPTAPWYGKAASLITSIAEGAWGSAGLPENNPFTTSFLLEALHDLQAAQGKPLTKPQQRVVNQKLELLRQQLIDNRGGVYIGDYPATAFLTQKAVRVLKRWGALTNDACTSAREFAWARLFEESIVISADRTDADVFELAYAALTASLTTNLVDMTPRYRDALEYCLNQFFSAQNERGLWPRGRPLFRYPDLGNAYCYDYELLVQILTETQLAPMLQDKLPRLTSAFQAMDSTAIAIGPNAELGWASGHLKPDEAAPESWTTASAYHFCHELRRFVVDAIRREIFAYVRASYASPRSGTSGSGALDPERFLDSDVPSPAGPVSLRRTLEDALIRPVLAEVGQVEQGHGLSRRTPNSAILYGPPGTSKTQLAEMIAAALGWPLLKLDPSHLTRAGLDRLHAETNLVFTMLASTERLVVLLDEFDELVLDRDQYGAESSSRFLTTAMLPKIAELASRRRIVYLLATNHIERFDDAISRAGRFDLVVPVMPPSLAEKLRRWPEVAAALHVAESGGDNLDEPERSVLNDLTYLEFQEISKQLARARSVGGFTRTIRAAATSATLLQEVGREGDEVITWKDRVLKQARRNRLGDV